jgi:hypothetical protein
MTLQRLAVELDSVRARTSDLVEDVMAVLARLSDRKLPDEAARREAITLIGSALRGPDNLEHLCQSLALAVRQYALLPANTPVAVYDEIWSNLIPDQTVSYQSRSKTDN